MTNHKTTTKETPKSGIAVEYETGCGEYGTAFSMGKRGLEGLLIVCDSAWSTMASNWHAVKWRYPGETEWRD